MKPTTVLKLIVDLVMVVLFITMVFAPQTGYLYHEVFGLVIGALVILHLFLNKTWIAGILKKRGALKPTLKKKAIFNLAIGLLTAGIIVTGILISIVLFQGNGLGSRPLLVFVHKWMTYLTLALLAVHLLAHAKYLQGALRALGKNWGNKGVRQVFTASFAIILIGFFAYTQLSPVIAGTTAQDSQVAATTPTTAAAPSATAITTAKKEETDEAATPTVEAATPAVTLDDYLSGMFCTGCSKHCPLIAPRCGKGEAQAEEATVQYQETYGTL